MQASMSTKQQTINTAFQPRKSGDAPVGKSKQQHQQQESTLTRKASLEKAAVPEKKAIGTKSPLTRL